MRAWWSRLTSAVIVTAATIGTIAVSEVMATDMAFRLWASASGVTMAITVSDTAASVTEASDMEDIMAITKP